MPPSTTYQSIDTALHHPWPPEELADKLTELLENRGIYYRLYQLQYQREELKLATSDVSPKIHE